MLSQHRAYRMGAFIAVLFAMGCPSNNSDTPLGVPVAVTVVKPNEVSSPSPLGASIHGTVTGADGSPASGASIIITDARIIEQPNAGEATTASDGTYKLRPVPLGPQAQPAPPWFVVATVNGTRMAGVVQPLIPRPNSTADAECNIDVASTLAVAGIAPFFVEDPNVPDKQVFLLADLNVDDFNALTAAVKAALTPDIKPTAKLKDLNPVFNSLKDKNQPVADAFNKLFANVQAALAIRSNGGLLNPNANLTPNPNATSTPAASGAATPTVKPTTGATATPTATPVGATPAPTPTPISFAPINVTLSKESSPTLPQGTAVFQMTSFNAGVAQALLIPDGGKIQGFGPLGPLPAADAAALLGGGQTVTQLQAVAANGTNVYAVANVGGTISLITFDYSGAASGNFTPTATVKALTSSDGTSAGATGSLIYEPTRKLLIMSDAVQNCLFTIDPATAQTTVYGGSPSTIGGNTETAGPVKGFGMSGPAGMMLDGTNLYVCELNNARILKIALGTDTCSVYVGKSGSNGNISGTLAEARLNNPAAITKLGNLYYVADRSSNNIRIIDPINNRVFAYDSATHADRSDSFIFQPRAIGGYNSKIYVYNYDGQLQDFTPPLPPGS